MKYFLRIVLFLSVFAGAPCFAQQTRTESNHTIHANISMGNFHAGTGYSYEWAFAPKWTVVGSAWLKSEFFWGENFIVGNYSEYILHPAISVEPRFYYNFNRRETRGKNTSLNSGSYLSTTFSCFIPSINGKNGAYRDFFHYGIAPHWGMRRVYSNNLFLEFHTGLIFLMAPGEALVGPDINLKFGYVF
ncbi:MAG: hypothetical protein LBM20_07330 [Rikenellaceae bacterium]|jgi:hypothetical protein|nr:hypothetical protein [Rikenellaceae bacterium]